MSFLVEYMQTLLLRESSANGWVTVPILDVDIACSLASVGPQDMGCTFKATKKREQQVGYPA